MKKAIFIDKDGTLIHDVPYNINPELITLTDTAIPVLKQWQAMGFLLIVISNQSGVARGYFTEKELDNVSNGIAHLLSKEGISIDGFYYCPHFEKGIIKEYSIACDCRKPKPGLILRAAKDFGVDLKQSWMIGDMLNDTEAGNAAGCQSILINSSNETEWKMNDSNKPSYIVKNLGKAASIIAEHS